MIKGDDLISFDGVFSFKIGWIKLLFRGLQVVILLVLILILILI